MPRTVAPPAWPAEISSLASLLDFLSQPGIPALVKDTYQVDFHPPFPRGYMQDPTVYVTSSDEPYSTFVFGRVRTKVVFRDARRRFVIDDGGTSAAEVKAAFARQIAQLALCIRDDDLLDCDDNFEIPVTTCTDASRADMQGGTCIELQTCLSDGEPCIAYSPNDDGSSGLVSCRPEFATEYPLQVGDWVLIEASFHKQEDMWRREYALLAGHARRLRFDTSGSAGGASAATSAEVMVKPDTPKKRGRVITFQETEIALR